MVSVGLPMFTRRREPRRDLSNRLIDDLSRFRFGSFISVFVLLCNGFVVELLLVWISFFNYVGTLISLKYISCNIFNHLDYVCELD